MTAAVMTEDSGRAPAAKIAPATGGGGDSLVGVEGDGAGGGQVGVDDEHRQLLQATRLAVALELLGALQGQGLDPLASAPLRLAGMQGRRAAPGEPHEGGVHAGVRVIVLQPVQRVFP